MTDEEIIAALRDVYECEGNLMATAADRMEALAARVLKLEERLQITHMYRMDTTTGEAVRYEVPPEERDSVPDKIACLEAEVELLEDDLAELTRKLEQETRRRQSMTETAFDWKARAERLQALLHEALKDFDSNGNEPVGPWPRLARAALTQKDRTDGA